MKEFLNTETHTPVLLMNHLWSLRLREVRIWVNTISKLTSLNESVREPVINYVKGHDRSGQPDKKRDHELKRRSSQRRSSNARQLVCVFQDMKPPKSILRKSTNMQRPIQRVKFTKAIARHTKIRDQNPSLGYICAGEPHQRSTNAPKFEDRSQEERVARARCPRSSVEAGQKCIDYESPRKHASSFIAWKALR